jgi:hypothetical protein
MTTRLRCPYCAGPIDPLLNPAGRTEPKDWDPCLCPECREISTFEFSLPGGLRKATEDDWRAWRADPRLSRALVTVARVQTRGET